MKITIVSQIPEKFSDISVKLSETISYLESENHIVDYYNIDDLDINPCTGCFNCWVKTPGKCIFHDDATNILKSQITSKWFIIICPITAGTVPYKIKSVIDRSIPIVMPYIGLYHGECHHDKRYENYANRAFFVLDDKNAEDKALDVLKKIADKNKKNMHADKMIVKKVSANNIKERINEIINS